MRIVFCCLLAAAALAAAPATATADWVMSATPVPRAIVVPPDQGGACSLALQQQGPVTAPWKPMSLNVWLGAARSGAPTVVAPGASYTFSCGGTPYAGGQTIGWLSSAGSGSYFVAISGSSASGNATRLNGAPIPPSLPCAGTNDAGQLIAGNCTQVYTATVASTALLDLQQNSSGTLWTKSGSSCVLTGAFANGAGNGLAGTWWVFAGDLVNDANNGIFEATASTALALTVANPACVTSTATITGTDVGPQVLPNAASAHYWSMRAVDFQYVTPNGDAYTPAATTNSLFFDTPPDYIDTGGYGAFSGPLWIAMSCAGFLDQTTDQLAMGTGGAYWAAVIADGSSFWRDRRFYRTACDLYGSGLWHRFLPVGRGNRTHRPGY